MAISKIELENILRQSFSQASIKLTDTAGDEDHYALEIEDRSFRGKSLINQHKMVKEALAEVMKQKLHAISIKTIAIDE